MQKLIRLTLIIRRNDDVRVIMTEIKGGGSENNFILIFCPLMLLQILKMLLVLEK